MANKYLGFSVTLGVDDGAGGYTTIAAVRDIDGPSLTTDSVEVTSRDSTNRYREILAGMQDGGEVTFDIVYDPADATHNATAGLVFLQKNGTSKTYQVAFPGSINWTFTAIVTKFQVKAPLEDSLTADVTLKISGEPTLA